MEDFYWFVGLFEGEGSVTLDIHDKGRPNLEISMVDLDVMERVSRLLNKSLVSRTPSGKNVKGESYKLVYKVKITGHKAQLVIRALLPYMSQRRQEKMREALEGWQPKVTYKTKEYSPRPKKGYDIPLLLFY